MTKERSIRREPKKRPIMSIKEKRAAKKAKKEGKSPLIAAEKK